MSNQITVTGNIGEPELKFTPSGKAVLNLSLADNHHRRKDDGSYEQTGTTWYRISLWDGHAQNAAEQLTKGARVIVTGRVETRPFKDREGNERESLEIRVQDIGPAISKREQDGAPQPAQQAQPWGQQSDTWGGQPAQSGGWG